MASTLPKGVSGTEHEGRDSISSIDYKYNAKKVFFSVNHRHYLKCIKIFIFPMLTNFILKHIDIRRTIRVWFLKMQCIQALN